MAVCKGPPGGKVAEKAGCCPLWRYSVPVNPARALGPGNPLWGPGLPYCAILRHILSTPRPQLRRKTSSIYWPDCRKDLISWAFIHALTPGSEPRKKLSPGREFVALYQGKSKDCWGFPRNFSAVVKDA